jgi:hypothetical protein
MTSSDNWPQCDPFYTETCETLQPRLGRWLTGATISERTRGFIVGELPRAYASKLGGNSLKSRALVVFVRRLFAKNFGSCYWNRATGSKTRRKRA